MSKSWWEDEKGRDICHICNREVDRSDPEAMFGLSGAPVHGECGREAMSKGKALRIGERPREDQPKEAA